LPATMVLRTIQPSFESWTTISPGTSARRRRDEEQRAAGFYFILEYGAGPTAPVRFYLIIHGQLSPSYKPPHQATSTGIGNGLIASRRPTHCYSYRLEGSFIPAPDFAGRSNRMHMCLIPMIYPYVSQPVSHFLHYAHEWHP
jgi:hypothetical protein